MAMFVKPYAHLAARLVTIWLGAIGLTAGFATVPSWAADEPRAWLGYRTGDRFTEPAISRHVAKNIYAFSFVSRYKYGTNFIAVDFLESDKNDPISGGGGGAQEVYGVYRHTLSLGQILDTKIALGPIGDVGLTIGFDRNSKNDPVSPRVRKSVIGPSVIFDTPGFFSLSILLRQERNHNGIVGTSVVFDDTWGMSLDWDMPVHLWNASFDGFIDYIAAKGKDGFGADTAPETVARTYLMFDIGHFFGKKRTFYAGAGYEYWKNKFGVASGPGNQTHAPMLALRAYL